MKNNNSYKSGKIAEFVARNYLRLTGFRILAQNYITGRGTNAGEVDIIAARANLLVFVEVKKRSDLNKAAYAVSNRQQQRIIRGAEAFLQKNPQYAGYDCRFDAVLISFPLQIEHIKNAWIS